MTYYTFFHFGLSAGNKPFRHVGGSELENSEFSSIGSAALLGSYVAQKLPDVAVFCDCAAEEPHAHLRERARALNLQINGSVVVMVESLSDSEAEQLSAAVAQKFSSVVCAGVQSFDYAASYEHRRDEALTLVK